MFVCPVCHSNSVGKIGSNQFYCWDCCIEFIEHNNKVSVFEVGDDGTLVMFTDGENVVAGDA